MKIRLIVLCAPLALVVLYLAVLKPSEVQHPWSKKELAVIQSLWLQNLPPIPSNPTNKVADNELAARFGHQLFFDPQFSKNGRVSCATCHKPELKFTDGLALAQGMRVGSRNTQTIIGVAYSPWLFWDGRKDSLWSQSLAPLESKVEHGGHRFQYVMAISLSPDYRTQYETLFGDFPDISNEQGVEEVFVNIGKSLEAYERKILPGISRFDNYVDHLVNGTEFTPDQTLTNDEIEGLGFFINQGSCIDCHNGPLFTNFDFHNTGIFPISGGVPDKGRVVGVNLLKSDSFNCLSAYSDDAKKSCDELRFIKEGDELIGAQKTPSLRALIGTEPYMHAGQINTLKEVLEHYNTAKGAFIGHNEAKPLNLNETQLTKIEAFLKSLDAPLSTESYWLKTPEGLEGEDVENRVPTNNY